MFAHKFPFWCSQPLAPMHITEGALHRLAHTPPTTKTHRIAPHRPLIALELAALCASHWHPPCIPSAPYIARSIRYNVINAQYAQQIMERDHKREPGASPRTPAPASGGLPPILKALHYPPVRIIHTTTQHIDTSYRVITSTNVARAHDPMPGMLRCCAANAAVLCTECCDAMH